MEFIKSIVNLFDIKKLYFAITTSSIIIQFLPYKDYVTACMWLIVIDVITGILCSTKEKYKEINVFTILKTFKSTKLKSKLFILSLFFIGLFAIHKSDGLLMSFGLSQFQMGIWYCAIYGIYELTSVFENLGKLDFPVAKQIKRFIEKRVPELKEDENDNNK